MILNTTIKKEHYISSISYINTNQGGLTNNLLENVLNKLLSCFLAMIIAYLTENFLFGIFVSIPTVVLLIEYFMLLNKNPNKEIIEYVTLHYSYIFDTKVTINLNDDAIIMENVNGVLERKISSIDEIVELKNQFLVRTRGIYIIIPKSDDDVSFKDLLSKMSQRNNIKYMTINS